MNLIRTEPEEYDFKAALEQKKPFAYFVGVALALVSVFARSALAFDLQELESPAQTRLSWVGQQLVQNGRPMQIMQLESELSPDALATFYQASWRTFGHEGGKSSIVKNMGQWLIVSTITERHNVVVQLRASESGSSGFVSATPLDTRLEASPIAMNFPQQWGTTLISSTESIDFSAKATTLIMKNNYSVGSNQSFYESSLQRIGWQLTKNVGNSDNVIMFFSRSTGSLEMAIRRENGETMIFATVRGGEV